MTDWRALGAQVGAALARFVDAAGGSDRVRAHYAAKFGTCRRCAAPLGGASPEQICEACHADEVLEQASGGPPPGEA